MKKESKKKEKRRLVILDAHAILHRAYHALPDFSSGSGEPTGALYGLVAMLLKAITELKPDYLVAGFDLPEATFRHEAYDEYKGTRKKTDDALALQIDRSRDVFKAFNIPLYEKAGFEADDIIGTIVEKTKGEKDIDIVIVSGDMDTLQLVSGARVRVYTLRKGIKDTIIYDEAAVQERFGFKPTLLPDFKGLRGDPSDNIVGIAGIGEKIATTLIQEFGSIEQLYKKLKKDPTMFEQAGVKKRILTLLQEHEEEAQFSKMLAEIRRDAPIAFTIPKHKWRESVDVDAVLTLFREFNFRTLSQRVKQLFGVTEESTVDGEGENKQQTQMSMTDGLDPQTIKETSVALWVLDSTMTDPSLSDILAFAGTDVFADARESIMAEIKKHGLEKIYNEIELPLIPVIERMEERGIRVDLKRLEALSKAYHKELSTIEGKIWKEAGREFNINSPKQLGEVLFDELGLAAKNQKRTATGARSTRESELEKIRNQHVIIEYILEHRQLQKLLSTYIDNIPHMVDTEGRLHATFLQTGTTTGRMSSNNPNLQNIPIKTERGRAIRTAFITAEGYQLVAFDYSQIELRVAAFLSGDEKLIEIFKSGHDIHTAVAAEVFSVPEEHVDKEMRRQAKVINFGILYGMGVNALRQNLGTDRKEAQTFYTEYFKNFSGLAQYLEHVKADTRRKGYTETFFGRRRYFGDINSQLSHIRAMAERMAINAPIQGTQSDIIKIAMARIDAHLLEKGVRGRAHLLLQVHDELVYEIQRDLLEELIPEIKRIMEHVIEPKDAKGVPLSTNVSIGDTWGEMKER